MLLSLRKIDDVSQSIMNCANCSNWRFMFYRTELIKSVFFLIGIDKSVNSPLVGRVINSESVRLLKSLAVLQSPLLGQVLGPGGFFSSVNSIWSNILLRVEWTKRLSFHRACEIHVWIEIFLENFFFITSIHFICIYY